ncbi:MAG: dephospho-CoA kinase [Acidobacteriota bacterium]|nr:dephospho-CoA kinase [Acidobacteriota bacterium]
MLKVGLTGGYASGKSFVAATLEDLGCHVIYADKLGHSVLEPDGEAYEPVLQLFGPEILSPGGAVDRKQLGSIVFASPDLLDKLTAIIHPAVFRLEQKLLAHLAGVDPEGISVVEAAILIETGRYRSFERIILTVCSRDAQIARGMTRDGLTREQVLARLANQMPNEEKQRSANYVIDTEGPKALTLKQTRKVFFDLKQLQGSAQ